MWFTVVAGVAAALRPARRAGARPRRRSGCSGCGSRVGTAELILHDVGNERRFLIFLPGAGRARGARARPRPHAPAGSARPCCRGARARWRCRSCFFALYVVIGAARAAAAPLRGRPERSSRGGTGGARHRLPSTPPGRGCRAGSRAPLDARAAALLIGGAGRPPGNSRSSASGPRAARYKNYEASLALGRVLPPGTLVHGKLANGLALENRIKPIFVGPRLRQLRGPQDARRCAIYFDLRVAEPGVRVAGAESGHPRRARRLSGPSHHHDVRRGRDHDRPRSRGAHRQVRIELPAAPGVTGRAQH